VRRAAQGQAIVDASWAVSSRGDGTFDRWVLFGSTAVQYVGWVAGAVVGALAGGALGDPHAYGLDAVYPAFFVALLLGELRDRRSRTVAALGAVVTTTAALIGGCAAVTVAIKAAGPVALGGRDLPRWFTGIVALLAPAILTALVVTQGLAHGQHLEVGGQTAGVAAGGLVVWRFGSIVACVVVAAAVTAGLRAL
jgi:branched-subunit amino acid transport protein